MSSTQNLIVGMDWKQITDGSATKTLQVLNSGWCYLFDSPTKPDAQDTGHLVDDFMTITAPTIAWVRSVGGTAGNQVEIAIS
jgi:hypothetical protein